MRILLVAPLVSAIDERRQQLGGAQILVADLGRGLARAGHRTSLAAAEGSFLTGVRVLPLGIDAGILRPADLGARSGPREDDRAQREAFARVRAWLDAHAAEIDVVHAHAYDAAAFDALRGAPRPVIHTLHLPPLDADVVRAARDATDARMIGVSHASARTWRDAGVRVDDVIHDGVDVAAIPLGSARGEHLLYAGRLSPEKGVETALDVAERLGRPIVVVGGIYDAAYHARAIAPRVRAVDAIPRGAPIHGAVSLGPRPRAEVHALMGGAAATLMPVRWEEPFGLVAVESLAAGTPVVAYRRGALPEIIDEQVGAIVEPDDADAFARAVQRVIGLDGAACRRRAMAFDLSDTIRGHEALYRRVTAATQR